MNENKQDTGETIEGGFENKPNPFLGFPLRALNIEKLKTEERLESVQSSMVVTKEGNPVSFEEFKELNKQKTTAERSLALINEAIEKNKGSAEDSHTWEGDQRASAAR